MVSTRKAAMERPGVTAALDYLRAGDTLTVCQLEPRPGYPARDRVLSRLRGMSDVRYIRPGQPRRLSPPVRPRPGCGRVASGCGRHSRAGPVRTPKARKTSVCVLCGGLIQIEARITPVRDGGPAECWHRVGMKWLPAAFAGLCPAANPSFHHLPPARTALQNW